MRQISVGGLLAVLVAVWAIAPGTATAADGLPRCSTKNAITDPEVHAPERIPAGKIFGAWFKLYPDNQAGEVSKVEASLVSKARSQSWKRLRPWKTWGNLQLGLKDKNAKLRVSWVETKHTVGDDTRVACQNSIHTAIRVWKGNEAKFRIRYLAGGAVEWWLKNRRQLCHKVYGSLEPRQQTAPGYYQLRLRGAGGNIRSTVQDICDGYEVSRGRKSGKWNLYFWALYGGNHWDFSWNSDRLAPGDYSMKWQIFRKKQTLLYGRFVARVAIR